MSEKEQRVGEEERVEGFSVEKGNNEKGIKTGQDKRMRREMEETERKEKKGERGERGEKGKNEKRNAESQMRKAGKDKWNKQYVRYKVEKL